MTRSNLPANPFIRLDPADNVVVARIPVAAGTRVESEGLETLQDVPAGHKIAACSIARGAPVLKYNTVIGYAAEDLAPGTWMHSHNILFDEVEKDYAFSSRYEPTDFVPPERRATFDGIVRPDGRVATRNYIGIFVASPASATVARRIAAAFREADLDAYPMIDGVVPFVHDLGDSMEWTGEPLDLLRRTLGGYLRHANTGAVLLIAQGGEINDVEMLLADQNLERGPLFRTMMISESASLRDAVETGRGIVAGMLPLANDCRRQPCSAEHLTVALQCGGSDGFSGLSANPALGAAMDILVRNGGTAILSETTEIFGVEHTLTQRAVSAEVGQKLIDRIDWWLGHSDGRDTQINGRVSPGNNAGGLANVLEKSLGGAKKSGNTGLMDVYCYAEPVTAKGFVFMDTPGYDPTAATGQIAGGANMVCFTTGRGSCFGSLPAPTMKLASNTPMYERMRTDMDLNCGRIIDGDATIEETAQEIFVQLLQHASGSPTKSELAGVGGNEFVPWQIGIVC